MRKGMALFVVLFLTAAGILAAQAAGGSSTAATPGPGLQATPPQTTTPQATPPQAAPDALPPGFDEAEAKPENPWRRFEIVSLGAFPLSLFYVGFGFDLGHYIGSDFDYRYAPWPFQNSASILPSDSERLVRIASAAALSLAIGSVDAIIHAGKMRAAQQRAAAETIELDSGGAGD